MAKYLLEFENGLSERAKAEAEARGYLSHVVLTLEDDRSFRLTFWAMWRLKLDFDDYIRNGDPCLAEAGLVIVPEVNLEQIHKSIESLIVQKHFDDLQPLRRGDS